MKYRIRRYDRKNLVIEQYYPKRKRDKWKVLGYYGTVEALAKALIDMPIHADEISEVRGFIKTMVTVADIIASQLSELLNEYRIEGYNSDADHKCCVELDI